MYKLNPMITLHSVTVELTVDQIRDLVHCGEVLHEIYNGTIPTNLRPLVDLTDDLTTLIQMEAAHA